MGLNDELDQILRDGRKNFGLDEHRQAVRDMTAMHKRRMFMGRLYALGVFALFIGTAVAIAMVIVSLFADKNIGEVPLNESTVIEQTIMKTEDFKER